MNHRPKIAKELAIIALTSLSQWIFTPCANSASHPNGMTSQSFTWDGHSERVIRFPERHLTLSGSCLKEGGNLECDAYSAYLKLSTGSLSGEPPGRRPNADPGSLICDLVLKQQVILAMSESKNEASFCRFPDGSWLGAGSIAYAFHPVQSQTSQP